MNLQDCSLSVLTWRTPKTLESTLATLAPIQSAFAERYVVCQESDPPEIEIARQNGFTPIALSENVGIQEGLARCAEVSKTEFVAIIENDCALINPHVAMETLTECLDALARNDLDVIKLSAMNGKISARYMRYWGKDMPPRKTWRGWAWPVEARSCSGQVVYHREFPRDGFGNVTRVSEHVYATTSR